MSKIYSLRLEGLDVPDGEIPLRDVASLGSALQRAATRIARQIAGSERRGRAPAYVDRLSELRLTGIGQGSTVLELRLGEEGALPLPGEYDLLSRRFEEAFVAIAENIPPEWASPLVTEALGRVVTCIEATGAVQLTASWASSGDPMSKMIVLAEVDESVWKVPTEVLTEEVVSVAGRLDRVDLRARRFRIQDDVGNDVMLEDVAAVDVASQLIGRRITATGSAERDGDRLVRLLDPTLSAEALPADWFTPPPEDLPLGGAMPAGGIPGLSATEVDEFLAEIRS